MFSRRCLITVLSTAAFLFLSRGVRADEPVKENAKPHSKPVTPRTLFFDPEQNGIHLEKQQIDYDLTNETSLRVGPYFLNANDVAMYLTKEHGEFYEMEFGFEMRRRIGQMYVASFRWPADYIDNGLIELQDDKGNVLWQRQVDKKDTQAWHDLLDDQRTKAKMTKERLTKMMIGQSKVPDRIDVSRPDSMNHIHDASEFGFAYKGVYELPINQITVPFRFCLSKEIDTGRVGVCSRRYKIVREYGNYAMQSVSGEVVPRVFVNDKTVTSKGTAVFLDFATPIKFSALLKNGTYFEFVARPKEIHVLDVIEDRTEKKIEIVGYGDPPLGDVEKDFYQDKYILSFLNFLPTIGDFRKFWRVTVPSSNPTIYLKGEGGVPFRQSFVYRDLPSKVSRLEMASASQRATYSSHPVLQGTNEPKLKLGNNEERVQKNNDTSFSWEFRSPEKGKMNVDNIEVVEDGHKFKAYYQVFRGFPAEISARMTGVLSSDLDVIVLGEVAGQYWFEKVAGLNSYYFSKLRWGVAATYFDTIYAKEPAEKGFVGLSVTNIDLKYRFEPGIWARDPSVGLVLALQDATYTYKQAADTKYTSKAQMLGGGLFWARSMPSVFDDIFNIIPFMRYPKWVDVQGVIYPFSLNPGQTSNFTLAVNFHGKIQWTPSFFGEAGFGLKNFSWNDTTIPNGNGGQSVALGVAYATVGLGFNF